jgi:hypothetical protein
VVQRGENRQGRETSAVRRNFLEITQQSHPDPGPDLQDQAPNSNPDRVKPKPRPIPPAPATNPYLKPNSDKGPEKASFLTGATGVVEEEIKHIEVSCKYKVILNKCQMNQIKLKYQFYTLIITEALKSV